MKRMKNLAAAFLLALPLTALPILTSTNIQAAETTKTETHTYTGNGSVKDMKKTAYHSKDANGNIYKADFMADKPTVTLTKKTTLNKYRTTWYATRKMSVHVSGNKSRTYYYITSSDKKISGWTWEGYLHKGIFKSAD
ncbi:hypothetical protein LCR01_14590 [Companilactobacillus crustorum]|uniref:D-alanyl-D-alanine carboxypeptidase n=3 Tax=Companilactobacillus TaxID=2767879 RepID=A0A837RG96_9LACO|nr:hypothetical protein [Companilactobacillus crustorum]HCD07191.1 hypothetical protein [Lactobacillus sp.]APU71468.1 hypothetical protein BI355_1149 [Companilactobacillus crustorum]KRK41982.1 hypothetical protein FD26_GL000929 [Companilactobacillus crustorum JCM 15951]KRO20051.1 hypothetical protein IV63_GL001062 [Companilactobacillus crustorum]WDT66506.1 hypothetical protein NV391_04695 [Companilactobacillus crustorum]